MSRLCIFLFVLLAPLGGCTEAPPPPPALAEDAGERALALALLEAADPADLAAAFERLRERPHGVSERLEQLDAQGIATAHRTRHRVVEGGVPRTVAADEAGTFDFGVFGRFLSLDDLDRLPDNPVPFVLPDDPTYLSPSGREDFVFAFAPDTTVGGEAVRVVSVTARPGEGDDQPLRSARLYVEAATGALVGARLHRQTSSVLYGETSILELMLQPGPERTWLPERTAYAVALRATLTGTRHFRLLRQYALEGAPDATPEGRLS